MLKVEVDGAAANRAWGRALFTNDSRPSRTPKLHSTDDVLGFEGPT